MFNVHLWKKIFVRITARCYHLLKKRRDTIHSHAYTALKGRRHERFASDWFIINQLRLSRRLRRPAMSLLRYLSALHTFQREISQNKQWTNISSKLPPPRTPPPPPQKENISLEYREARKVIVDFNLVSCLRRKQKPEIKSSWHSSFSYFLSTALHTTNLFFQLTVEINL
jgi:hypothetical protein